MAFIKRNKNKKTDMLELLDILNQKGYYCDMQIDGENYTLNVCNRDKKLSRRIKKEDN